MEKFVSATFSPTAGSISSSEILLKHTRYSPLPLYFPSPYNGHSAASHPSLPPSGHKMLICPFAMKWWTILAISVIYILVNFTTPPTTTCEDVVPPRKYSNHKSYELTNNYKPLSLPDASGWDHQGGGLLCAFCRIVISESHSYWSLH